MAPPAYPVVLKPDIARIQFSPTQTCCCFNVLYPGDSDGKESALSAGDPGSIPALRRSPGEGKAMRSSLLAWRVS